MPKTIDRERSVGTVTSKPLKINFKPRKVRTIAKPLLRYVRLRNALAKTK